MNPLQIVYLKCIHALINVPDFFEFGADTQYGLMNYIAKFSLANDEYQISKNARLLLPIKKTYTRGTDFPRQLKPTRDAAREFTFEHPIPSSHIRNLILNSDKSYDSVNKILSETCYVVVVTQAENSQIPSTLKSKMPENWELGMNPYARYTNTSIILDGTISVTGAIKR